MKLLYLNIGAALFSLSQVMGEDIVDINTPFKVASGSQKGSCDNQKDVLNHMLQQTTDMANSAADAVREIMARKAKDQSSSRMMFMLFNVDGLLGWIRDKKKLPQATRTNLQLIGPYYAQLAAVADDANFGHRLYCNADFLVYTAHTYEDGKETDSPISDAIAGATSAYWDIDAQAYVTDRDPSNVSPCSGDTRGFTSIDTKTIVICPSAFEAPILQNFDDILKDQSTNIKEGDALRNNYLSLPGILLHELAHAVAGGAVIDQKAVDGSGRAYTVQDCIDLADQKGTEKALLNAETWHLFALSTYLNAWDWALGVASTPERIDAGSQ